MSERDLNNTVTPNPKLAVDYCGIKMKNPIIAASGTFGNGPEYAGYLDLSNEVGAISVKGLTLKVVMVIRALVLQKLHLVY